MNRQRLIRFVGLGAALALAGTAGAQTDHSPAPMMAPAKAPLSEEAYREQQAPGGRRDDADTITARFRDRFSGDGEARIAVLWNEALSSRVSDWQSRQRATVGGAASSKRAARTATARATPRARPPRRTNTATASAPRITAPPTSCSPG